MVGVFQGGSGYPLSGLVSAFSDSSGPTSQAVKCFYLTLISNFYFLGTEVTIVSLMVTIRPDYLPTHIGGLFPNSDTAAKCSEGVALPSPPPNPHNNIIIYNNIYNLYPTTPPDPTHSNVPQLPHIAPFISPPILFPHTLSSCILISHLYLLPFPTFHHNPPHHTTKDIDFAPPTQFLGKKYHIST